MSLDFDYVSFKSGTVNILIFDFLKRKNFNPFPPNLLEFSNSFVVVLNRVDQIPLNNKSYLINVLPSL